MGFADFAKNFAGGLGGSLDGASLGGSIGSMGISTLGGLAIGGLTKALGDGDRKRAEKSRKAQLRRAGQLYTDAGNLAKSRIQRQVTGAQATGAQSLIDRGLYNSTVLDGQNAGIAERGLDAMAGIDSNTADKMADLELTFVDEGPDLGTMSALAQSLGRASFTGQRPVNSGQSDDDVANTPAGTRGDLVNLERNASLVGRRVLASTAGANGPGLYGAMSAANRRRRAA